MSEHDLKDYKKDKILIDINEITRKIIGCVQWKYIPHLVMDFKKLFINEH